MSGTVTAKAFTGIQISHKQTNDDGAADDEISAHLDQPVVFASGSSSGQVNAEFTDERSISASSSETLDLSGGTITDGLNNLVSFSFINAVEIIADSGNVNNVIVGNAGSNPFLGPMGGTTPTVTLKPGERLVWVAPGAGWSVTNSSNDNLKVANSSSGTAVGYRIKIVGRA